MDTKALLMGKIESVDDSVAYDLKIGIGGDGILLKMIRTLQKKDGLLLGVNFGTLGFLSELSPDNAFEGLDKIFKGKYEIDIRMLLKAFVWQNQKPCHQSQNCVL